MKTIITGYSTTSQGVAFELSEKASMDNVGIKAKQWYVSWDKIGEALFKDQYEAGNRDEIEREEAGSDTLILTNGGDYEYLNLNVSEAGYRPCKFLGKTRDKRLVIETEDYEVEVYSPDEIVLRVKS